MSLDRESLRAFALVLADNAQEMHDHVSIPPPHGERGRAFVLVAYGVALALADPGIAQMISREAITDQTFESLCAAAAGITRVVRAQSANTEV